MNQIPVILNSNYYSYSFLCISLNYYSNSTYCK